MARCGERRHHERPGRDPPLERKAVRRGLVLLDAREADGFGGERRLAAEGHLVVLHEPRGRELGLDGVGDYRRPRRPKRERR